MRLAFLYAGQGAQRVGMGRDFYEEYPLFRELLDSAALDFDLKAACFEGPMETLSRTRYTQPCLFSFAAGVTALLYARGIVPKVAAGLSLGEYSALHAAGVFDFQTALSLVAFRGRVMEEAVTDRPSAMYAILQLGREETLEVCREAGALGVCELANLNCPGQLVIGGDRAATERAAALALERGARRAVELPVSGPFHTSLMAPAGDALRARFRDVQFGAMRFPVLFNCLGDEMGPDDSIPALLEKQVQSSVYMEDTIRRMEARGIDTVVEIGPSKTLAGFVRKTAKGIRTYSIDSAADFAAVAEELSKGEMVT